MSGKPDKERAPDSWPLSIGLDIGATWAKAWIVRRTEAGLEAPGEPMLERWNVTGFRPLDLQQQQDGAARSAGEVATANELVRTAAAVVMRAAEGLATAPALAIATAGPKTEDGRGIALWRRGPRVPHLLDDLLAELARQGFLPAATPTRLFDDGAAAAAGELAATNGSLHGITEALYIGPGTGVAEAYISGGQLAPWPASIPPAYAEPMPSGATYGEPEPSGATYGDTIALAGQADLTPNFAALAELIALRKMQFAALDLPAFERITIGAKGGELLAAEPQTSPLWKPLKSKTEVRASNLYAAAALGAVALETAPRR